MTRIICVASVVYFKIRFFFEIYYHENSNFPFAAGLLLIGLSRSKQSLCLVLKFSFDSEKTNYRS
ncbi:hypothetical protein IYZ83_001325 [Wolbachia pipientis]|uniref:hypothetical protein n=1 Tax=Wolbachia pipientis TaxID=955 RepID=UPI001BDA819E|nr:hypothetical protein [Wolbachia pipientis]UIP91882.1 hypothetical protein IYZ83_001325 [Wolbachia pipientis]